MEKREAQKAIRPQLDTHPRTHSNVLSNGHGLTGIPANLQTGIESLSGVSMENVQVRWNSPKPAAFRAHAFAKGDEIHLAPGQERHLPHEAWHVAQQRQGRVQPSFRVGGTPINMDARLEREAGVMGTRALHHQPGAAPLVRTGISASSSSPLQGVFVIEGEAVPESLLPFISGFLATSKQNEFYTAAHILAPVNLLHWLAQRQVAPEQLATVESKVLRELIDYSGAAQPGIDPLQQDPSNPAIDLDDLLVVAGVRSTNPLLRNVFEAVRQYNLTSQVDLVQKATALHQVVRAAAEYLSSKPPQPTVKNTRRWTALSSLVAKAETAAQRLGVKLARGPADFKDIDWEGDDRAIAASVWLEILDPRHRHAYRLSRSWRQWLSDPVAQKSKVPFWDFAQSDPELVNRSSVKYCNDSKYAVSFDNEQLKYRNGQVVDTKSFKSTDAGSGWGIFVVGVDGSFHIGAHEKSVFHHTTFLAGLPVLAAGEICVENGVVRGLTAKTGHYWVTSAMMCAMLRKISWIPGHALVRPDLTDHSTCGLYKYYRVSACRASDLTQPILVDWATLSCLPDWALFNVRGHLIANGENLLRAKAEAAKALAANQPESSGEGKTELEGEYT